MKLFVWITAAFSVLFAPLATAEIPQGTDYSQLNKVADADAAYRNRVFRAYLPQELVCERLRTSNYSAFENPTGIFYTAGETVRITLPEDAPQGLSLIIHNFNRDGGHAEMPLRGGVNEFAAPVQGLAYFNYRSATPQAAPALQVRIEGGYVNGVFTQHDDATTWKRLLANARGNIMDILS